jgi:hypothetical protein
MGKGVSCTHIWFSVLEVVVVVVVIELCIL